ncbi:MAG: carboxypeptidase-like regulatory domain-containing protein, partial [Armatimonadia bacterium]
PAVGIAIEGWTRGVGGADMAITEADGTYLLRHLAAGKATVVAQPGQGYATPPRRSIALAVGRNIGIDFSLTTGGFIKGRVTSAVDGRPVSGAYVIANVVAGGALANAQTGQDGIYQIRLAPGKYRLACRWPGPEPPPPAPNPEVIVVEEGRIVEGKNLKAKPPQTLYGQVLMPDGTPAADAEVQGYGAGLWDRLIEVRADGTFEILLPQPVPDKPVVFVARDLQHNLYCLLRADRLPGQLTLRLQPAAIAVLPVVSPEGQPLPNLPAMVTLTVDERSGGFALGHERSGPDGLARFVAMPPEAKLTFAAERNMLHLVLGEGKGGQQSCVLQTGEERTLTPLVMNPKGRSLNVFVGDAEGRPIAKALVYAQHVRRPFVTDDKGKVTLIGLAVSDKIELLAAHPTQALIAVARTDPDTDPWPGLLLREPGRATGVVIGTQGKPLAGATVSLQTGRGGWWAPAPELRERLAVEGFGQWQAQTGEDGRWRADKLVPGAEYQVVVFAAKAANAPGDRAGVFIAEGGPAVQDVGKMTLQPRRVGPHPGPPAPQQR